MSLAPPVPHVIPNEDPRYPIALRDLSDPPPALFCLGVLPRLEHAVAIVGTRGADPAALAFAHSLAADLARHHIPIVSGGARGIDAAAHLGALESAGATIAVLATGLVRPYPRCHAALFDRIVDAGGALVSEVPDAVPAVPGRFLARNRIVAGLARLVIIVQAPAVSGALSTAAHAAKLRRPVLAVPAAPWDPRGLGGLALLASGASLCRGVGDVLSKLELPAAAGQTTLRFHGGASNEQEGMVLRKLGATPIDAEDLAAALGLPATEVLCTLTRLEMRGIVEQRAAGFARTVVPKPKRPAQQRAEKPP